MNIKIFARGFAGIAIFFLFIFNPPLPLESSLGVSADFILQRGENIDSPRVNLGKFSFPQVIFASYVLPASGFVNDFANVLTSVQKDSLEARLFDHQNKTGNQISILIIKSLAQEQLEDFAIQTFEEWKIGEKGKDNGLLLLLVVEDRKIRIEVGYGLEPNLNDSQAGEIIRNIIQPELQKSDYYNGLLKGVEAIEQKISQSDSGSGGKLNNLPFSDKIEFYGSIVLWLVFVFDALIVYFISFLARSKSFWAGGVVGLVLGSVLGLIFFSLLVGFFVATFLGLLGLLLDWYLSKNFNRLKHLKKRTDWWSTGGGFFGGRGGGFGGFRGFGGGRSGGGGASGSW